jgi:hypothetical protein
VLKSQDPWGGFTHIKNANDKHVPTSFQEPYLIQFLGSDAINPQTISSPRIFVVKENFKIENLPGSRTDVCN